MSSTLCRLLSLSLTFLLAGCSRTADPRPELAATDGAGSPAGGATSAATPLVTPYPLGRWRLGDRQQLESVVLGTSHILIRSADSTNDDVSFNLATWSAVLPPATRTRAEALALAEAVARQARAAPDRFSELAAAYSEDLTTKDRGGSLGGVTASQLTTWPQVLDALAAIAPGEPSQVVETWYGFHVFLRHAPPPEQRVSGAQIVIGHEQAPWLSILARGALPKRTREQARALAHQVYEQARSQPDRFAELVDRYSEHRTAAVGGDFGSYSTAAPTWFPRQVEVLAGLRVGELAAPIETLVGYEIIQRTPERPRQLLATDSLWLTFTADAPDAEPSSRVAVLARARAYAADIAGDAQRFAELQGKVCCTYVLQWEEGLGTPALTSMLKQLELGQVATEPVLSESSFVLVRRIEPTPTAQRPTQFELPAPELVDIDYHFSALQAPFAEALVHGVGEKAEPLLALNPGSVSAYRKAHDLAGRLSDTAPTEHSPTVLASLRAEVRGLLDEQQYATYEAVMQRAFRDYLLDPAHETAIPRLK
jgi:hypothetical protein